MSEKTKMVVKYNDLGDNQITLTPAIVKKYLTDNPRVTDQEVAMFMKLCEAQKLNPFIREVYLIKYGNQRATFVTGKEAFLKRAKRDPDYRGHKAWTDGKIPDMTATAEVYVKDYQCPVTVMVDYDEYVGKKADGTVTGMWKTKPKTMLRKVALVQALREAFPDSFGGLYSQEEINSIDHDLDSKIQQVDQGAVEAEFEMVEEKPKAEKPKKASPKKAVENRRDAPKEPEATIDPPKPEKEPQKDSVAQESTDSDISGVFEEREQPKVGVPEEHKEVVDAVVEAVDGEVEKVVFTRQGPSGEDYGKTPGAPKAGETATFEYTEYVLKVFQSRVERTLTMEMLETYVGKHSDEWDYEIKNRLVGLLQGLQKPEDDDRYIPFSKAFPMYED